MCVCVLFISQCSENVHQLGLHIGAQMAHHRAEERRPFGLRASLFSTAAMTHLPDVVQRLIGVWR